MNAQWEWKKAYRKGELLSYTREERHDVPMWGWRDLIIRAALERRIERLEREKVAHIRTFKQINDQAHRATLVQDRSAHIIKQTCAIIAEEAAEWIDAV